MMDHTPKPKVYLVWSIDKYGFVSVEILRV